MAERRIIFVNRVYWPSAAATSQLLSDLAGALAARGWSVHVIAAGTEPGPRDGVAIHRTGPGEHHAGLLSRAVNYGRFLSAARRELLALAAPGDIVVLMTDPPLLAAAGTGPARRRGARVVHWIQDIYPEIVAQHAGAWLAPVLWPLKEIRNRAWRAADRCLPVSVDMLATVKAQGVAPDSIVAMPNWAPPELDVPPSAAAVAAQRQAWGVTDKFVVAYSGNLGRVHVFAPLLAAAGRLRDEPDIVFLFIGAGARFDDVQAEAAARDLPNVRFLPAQPRESLGVALAAADAHFVTLRPGFERLVSPSKAAGIFAAGRPALFVGPPDCELAALVARERCGLCFPPGDGAGLADTIRRLHHEPALRAGMARAARECYERHFTFAAAVTRWDELLRVVAGRR
jgi:glycosyltransferase involved in cell wall biosynthesis